VPRKDPATEAVLLESAFAERDGLILDPYRTGRRRSPPERR
jgi:hypothetical protein